MGFVLGALLRTAWIAATLPILVASIPWPKLQSFHDLLLHFAKRGKIMHSSPSKKWTVPQKFFCHFYILAVFWTTVLLVTTWLYAYRTAPLVSEPFLFSSITNYWTGGSHIFSWQKFYTTKEHRHRIWLVVFLLLLMEAQVLRRLFETIYIFRYSPTARMHIFGYLTGLFFYTAAPLSLCCTYATEVFEFTLNLLQEFIVRGKDRMQMNEFDWWSLVKPFTQLRWYAWIGAAIFLWGWLHQRRCHRILGLLRENNDQVDDYKIPHGDWFDCVSSPHYLAEIVVYGGIVVASGCLDITILLLFAFVVVNLVFSAAEMHRWYLRKFDNYPQNRFAIIPFVL